MRSFGLVSLLGLSLALPSCSESEVTGRSDSTAPVTRPSVEMITSPAGPGAGEPFLSNGHDGSLLMSWLEPAGEGSHALRFSRYGGGGWSEPKTIVERDDLFVNWADFPSIVETPAGLIAHWLQKSGEGTYSYDVVISRSTDQGETWTPGDVLHTDGIEAEHGFVSLVPEGDESGVVGALWLDGRNMTGGSHGHGAGSMTLRFARIHPDGSISDRQELDDRVCECCQTSMTRTGNGFVAVYRDRSDGEIRDIGVVREIDGEWSDPAIVHDDEWKIAACPVNGPQIDAIDDTVAVAWYTGAPDSEGVFLAFSENGGSFVQPVRVDDGGAIGRVDTLLVSNEEALVVWLGDEGEILARTVGREGDRSAVITIGKSSSSRASGFPRITMIDGDVYVAWTEPDGTGAIRVASIHLEEIS